MRKTDVEVTRLHRGDLRRIEVAEAALELGGTAERLLDGDLLVELEADEQRERLGHEQPIGLVIAGERQSIDGGHDRMVARLLRSGRCRPMPARDDSSRRPTCSTCATGRWLDDRRILVAGERIEAILAPGEPAPADAMPVALGGGWVVPGLIDCHSHLIGELEYAGIPAIDASPAQEAMRGVRNARDTLRAGFTTVRDVGTFWAFVDVALRDAIDAGWTPGPRMQCAGAYITCPGGGGEVTGEAPSMGLPDALRFGVVRDPEEVRAKVRALIAGGASVIKCIVTGAVLTRGTDVGAVELAEPLVRAAVEEAAANGAYVAAHAHGTEGIKVAIRAGVRSIEHGSLIDDEGIAMLVDTGTYLGRRRLLRRLDRAGGRAGRLAGRDDGQERRDHAGAARRVQQGGGGRRPARLRHRQRRLSAPDGGDPARLPGPPRADARGGDPVRDPDGRRAAWAGRTASAR